MRGTVQNNKGALPGQGLGRLCLKTAPTDVGANGVMLSTGSANDALRQDRRFASSVVAQAKGAT
jgi:hypothetical protein